MQLTQRAQFKDGHTHSTHTLKKQLSLLSLIFLFTSQGLFSQSHLLKTDRHGYDFNWLNKGQYETNPFENIGWDNTLSIGYTHAGRVHVLVGLLNQSGSQVDILTPRSWQFDSQISFAILKQGIDKVPLSLNGLVGFQSGSPRSYTDNLYKFGVGLYTRIEKSDTYSINPGISVQFFGELGEVPYFFPDILASCDFLFNRFKVSPTVALGEYGFRAGVGLGFVLPTQTK